MSKKIYISPERRPGPHGLYIGYPGVYEHDVCYEIAEYEKVALERCGFFVAIASRPSTMAQRCSESNAGKFDMHQTLHTNGGGGIGPECFYYNHTASIKANQLVYDRLAALYKAKTGIVAKRGIKNGMHFYENANTNMVSVYPEIAFHDNPTDAKFIVENKREIGESLARGVCDYFGVAYVPEKPPVTDYKALYEAEKARAEKAESKLAAVKKVLEG